MYSRLHALSEESVAELLELKSQVKFSNATGSRRRQGMNGLNALSIYNYSKWFEWRHKQRELVKTILPARQTETAKQVWFLEIPKKTGFLDVMTYWVGKGHQCGKVCAYALQDQSMIVGGRDVHVKKGEGIYFCLSEVHSIKPSKEGQLWFCVMTQYPAEDML